MRRSTLGDAGHEVTNPLDRAGRIRYGLIGLGAVGLIVILSLVGVITAARLSDIVVGVTFAAAVALFAIMLTSHEIDTAERHRVQSFIPMFVASAILWSPFQQQFTVMALYAEQRLNLNLFGWSMPPSWVQSINRSSSSSSPGCSRACGPGWGRGSRSRRSSSPSAPS